MGAGAYTGVLLAVVCGRLLLRCCGSGRDCRDLNVLCEERQRRRDAEGDTPR